MRSEKAKPNLLFYTVCVSTPICAALDRPKKGLALLLFFFFFSSSCSFFFPPLPPPPLLLFFFSSSFAARKEVAPNKFPAESFSALCSARTMAPPPRAQPVDTPASLDPPPPDFKGWESSGRSYLFVMRSRPPSLIPLPIG